MPVPQRTGKMPVPQRTGKMPVPQQKLFGSIGIFCSIINLSYDKTGTFSWGTGILSVAAFCSIIKFFRVRQAFFLVEQASCLLPKRY
ncbi:hypothetical protein QUA08_18410 [Microcoleus sp. T3B2]